MQQWRRDCPELTIRSTFIVGFPGETEAQFEELLDFLDEAQLDRVGCFTYSAVEGAVANALPGAVDEDIKQERQQRLMLKQAEISAARLQQKIGTRQRIIIDGVHEDDEGVITIGRSMADAPEIDGQVYLEDVTGLASGEFVDVTITAADEHDLWASLDPAF